MMLVITAFHYTRCGILKCYPCFMNFLFFTIFFVSSFQKETVIQKTVKLIEKNITPQILDYTRKLTYVWAGFTFCNFLISVMTVFLSENVWAVYNGCISYILVGSLFCIEYIVRINFKRKHDC